MPTPVSFDPATYNSTTIGDFTLGAIYEYLGRQFRFIQNTVDAAIADGTVCTWASATTYLITGCSRASALTGATTLGGPPAGVGVGAISTSNYGFLLVVGLHTNVLGVATITLGRQLRLSATADSVDNVSNAYDPVLGESVSALSGGRVSVAVHCA
jgi:hypothetical protein